MAIIISILLIFIAYIFRRFFKRNNSHTNSLDFFDNYTGPIAFFHPFCNDCGGGERVLWFIISHIQNKYPLIFIKIYTCDDTEPNLILKRVYDRFNIQINIQNIEFYLLPGKNLILPSSWPRFTLFGQTLGSIILGIQSLIYPIPDVLIDTTGFVFFGVILKFFGCRRYGAYVHFPTISTDMIHRVSNRSTLYNNQNLISTYIILTYIKLYYYKIFALWYKFGGFFIDFVLCNSHWTHNHIKYLWNKSEFDSVICYPPCSPHFFKNNSSDILSKREFIVLSVSQFRPEKDHKKQIDIAAKVLRNISNTDFNNKFNFIFVGSTRSKEDNDFLNSLIDYAKLKKVENIVEFKVNLSFNELSDLMSKALVGLHTMNQEHFGIGIVEMMASGLIMVAHNSGGPQSDILVNYNGSEVGFLCQSVKEYSETISKIFTLESSEIEKLRENSIASVNDRFSDERFYANITRFIEKLVL